MKKMIQLAVFLLLGAAFLSGCSEQASESRAPDSRADSIAPSGSKNASSAPVAQVSLESEQKSQVPPIERKIVRNADFQLESDEPEAIQQKISSIAESLGGFVVESTQSSSDVRANRRDTVTMTIRVPAEKFGGALEQIRAAGARVIVESVKTDDVTEEFIDVEARLKAKKALEAQFLEIMKRAQSVEDALDVQTKLSEVRSEIEKIEGRLRFLQNQTSLSTIKVRIQTPAAFANNSKGFFYRFGDAVGTGVDAAISFVFGFITFAIAVLPFLILVVLPIYLVLRYLVRKARRRRSAVTATEDQGQQT